MGNGTFTRYNGGKTHKLNLTQSALGKGYTVYVCTKHMVPAGYKDVCVRCAWEERMGK